MTSKWFINLNVFILWLTIIIMCLLIAIHSLCVDFSVDCCLNKTCFCFTSKGLCTVGQSEVVIVLECLPDENTVPLDVFRHFQLLYEQASKGIFFPMLLCFVYKLQRGHVNA